MNLSAFIHALEHALPPETAMKGDRIGLQLQSGREEISSVLVTMELTDSVAEEAIARGADCIVSFHPLIFSPLMALTNAERVGRICTRLIASGVALAVAHTNFDAFPKGTSAILAERLGLTIERTLAPDATREGFGMGIVASINVPESVADFTARIFAVTAAPIRHNTGKNLTVQSVAIVAGSGSSFIDHALAANVDAFITADVKYHDFHRTEGVMTIFDPGHYEMEQFVPFGLAELLGSIAARAGQKLHIMRSEIVPNPILYYPGTEVYRSAQYHALKQ
jgi:dinuclear metal center YbgI/SA1388 family protein